MLRRNVAMTVVLTILTCGLYLFYWHFVTTAELKERSGSPDLTPGLDLALGILTCGVWYFYSSYRNAEVVHRLLGARQPHEDRALLILILNIAALATGVTAVIAAAILQDEYNKLADAGPPLLTVAASKPVA